MVDLGRGTDRLHFKYKSIPRLTKDGKYIHVKKPVIEATFRKFSESKNENNREIKLHALIDSGRLVVLTIGNCEITAFRC